MVVSTTDGPEDALLDVEDDDRDAAEDADEVDAAVAAVEPVDATGVGVALPGVELVVVQAERASTKAATQAVRRVLGPVFFTR